MTTTSAFMGFWKLAAIWRARAEKMVSRAGASPSERYANQQAKDFWAQMAEDASAVAEALESQI